MYYNFFIILFSQIMGISLLYIIQVFYQSLYKNINKGRHFTEYVKFVDQTLLFPIFL